MKLAWNSLILFGSFSFSIDFGSLCVSKSFCCFWSDFLFLHLEFDFYLYGFLLLWKVFCSFFNWVFFCFYRSFVTFNGISCFELFLILMEFDCNGVSLFCLGFLCFDWFPLEFADLLLVLGVSQKNFDTFDEFIIFFHVGFWLEFLALIYFLILILTEFGWNSLNWFGFYFFQLTFVWFLLECEFDSLWLVSLGNIGICRVDGFAMGIRFTLIYFWIVFIGIGFYDVWV